MNSLAKYFTNLSTGRIILWCYLIWYLVVLFHYFDPNLLIWLTSLGWRQLLARRSTSVRRRTGTSSEPGKSSGYS